MREPELSHARTLTPSHLSRQHIPNDVAMHVGQAAFDAVVIKTQPLVIQAEQMQNRGVQIVDRCDVLNRLMTELIRRDRKSTRLNSSHGKLSRMPSSA